MKTTTTVIHGLAIDVLIVETVHADAIGTLFYRAEILIRDRETGVQNLIRRTRVPGTGDRVPLRGVAPALAVPSGQSRELISLRLAG